jgi:hypothetical protein
MRGELDDESGVVLSENGVSHLLILRTIATGSYFRR